MKEKGELKKEIEAVLFAAGRKVAIEEIAKLTGSDEDAVNDALAELKEDYKGENSPLLLAEEADGYKLTVKERYIPIVKEVTPHTELNKAMMGTLAYIAWKQPVMQAEVIKSRTSQAYDDIRNLVEMGFISKEKHGRTFILKPTGKFFEYFDLPSKEAVKEVFKGMEDVEESQKKLEDIKEPGEELLGKLDVYEISEEKEKPVQEPEEKLGGLKVFSEEEKEEGEAGTEEESGEAITEESEKEGTEEEKAEGMIHGLAEEDEGKEEASEEFKESGIREEAKEESGDEKEEDKRRLPKELEEFADMSEEEKEDAEKKSEEKEPEKNE